jgi:hypothetical protein
MSNSAFLFRLDSSRDNDAFMMLRRASHGDRLYSGIAMKVGPGWIPDFIEVNVDNDTNIAFLTLVELEATEIVARASCRKYIPEGSASVAAVFSRYLDAVLAQCRATADPRLGTFQSLKNSISGATKIVVQTACALRTSSDFLEIFPLLNQHDCAVVQVVPEKTDREQPLLFEGNLPFSRDEADDLRRVVHVLHSVVTGKDHGGGKLKGWRYVQRKVLIDAVSLEPNRYPELSRLVSSNAKSGTRVDCDKIVGELSDLWIAARADATPNRVRQWVKTFHPIVVNFPGHESMQNVFGQARRVLGT